MNEKDFIVLMTEDDEHDVIARKLSSRSDLQISPKRLGPSTSSGDWWSYLERSYEKI